MAKVNRRNVTDEDKSKIEKVIREIADESHKTEDSLSPLGAQSFASLMADLCQGINRVSSNSRCLNRTFP